MKLEESLNGCYPQLYEEVVTNDVYKIRDVEDIVSVNDPNHIHVKGHKGIKFTPDVVIDLGANIGIFSRYAHDLFPKAQIIAIEPDEENFNILKDNTSGTLINKALGKGKIFRYPNAANGAMEVYVSSSVGYDAKHLKTLESTPVKSFMITDLKDQIKPKDKVLCKIDIEGSETNIFNDPDSMAMLNTFYYIAIEMHYYGSTAANVKKVKTLCNKAMDELKATHKVLNEGIYFYATKK